MLSPCCGNGMVLHTDNAKMSSSQSQKTETIRIHKMKLSILL